MTTAKQEEAYHAVLLPLLLRVHDAQKFAEAKNAGLLALDSAWAVAAANILLSDRVLKPTLMVGVAVSLALLLVSGILCLISLLPRLNLSRLLNSGPFRNPCLMYFGDIATMKPADYISEVRQRYSPAASRAATDAYFDDLAGQIAANSAITARKFRLFNWAAIVAALAWLVIAVPGLWSAFALVCTHL